MKTETTKTYVYTLEEIHKALKLKSSERIKNVWTSIQYSGNDLIKIEIEEGELK